MQDETEGSALYAKGVFGCLAKECYCVFLAKAYTIKIAISVPTISTEMMILTDSASCLLESLGARIRGVASPVDAGN